MSLRRIAALLFALAAACAKDVNHDAGPASVDYSVFDPSAAAIPLPNDLALATAATLPAGAQKDLLLAFAAQGGFPNDIEVPITIDFQRAATDASGARSAPLLDLATVNPATVLLLKLTATGAVPATYDTSPGAITQTQNAATTTLRLRAPRAGDGSRNWEAGTRFAVAVRGGPSGVKTGDGQEIHAMPAMFLLLSGKNLADPANQALLPDPSAGAQLEAIRQNYLPVFMLVDRAFPSRELANLQTFQIAPRAGTGVRVDQTAGVVPLPFDLLRTDPDGTIILNQGFGPAAAGLDTLDGFSTTAMMLAPTSAPIDAATVTGNVFLFKLGTGAPALVSDVAGALVAGHPERAVYVTQPPDINQPCASASGSCSTVIGLQPAVPAPTGTPAGTLFLPPLDEKTEYAIVVTKGVKDATGAPLARSTVAKILLDVASPVSVNGRSQLAGLDDASTTMLEHMRQQLAAVFPALPGGKTKADVAMAYTFKTQSISDAALRLSALPFSIEQGAAAAVFTPQAAAVVDTAAAFGLPATFFPDVDSFFDVTTPTLDAIDPTTGALRADLATLTPAQLAGLVKPLHAFVAVPKAASVPSCGLPAPNDQLRCAKLVTFEHGLGGGHLQSISFANSLARRGFVVAAIDFPLHGDRAYCSANTASTDCNAGGTCNLIPGGEGQGDPPAAAGQPGGPPGICSNGNQLNAQLTSVASGRYFVSGNFFRIRDAFRQNLIDQSALGLSLARPPAPLAAQPAANPFASALRGKGIAVDPSAVYLEGISLGGITGSEVLATNPRITRGALSVAGGTTTDVLTTAPAFTAQVDALFLSLGIDRSQVGTDPAVAARYLQTISIAKWILDPGEPLNFARNLRTSPLPNLLSPTPALQAPKDVWGQLARGDTVVPNPFNLLLFNVGAVPFTAYTHNGGDAPHSMLATSPTAQSNAAGWLLDLTNPGAAVDLTDF
jgi:hypothetical protein